MLQRISTSKFSFNAITSSGFQPRFNDIEFGGQEGIFGSSLYVYSPSREILNLKY